MHVPEKVEYYVLPCTSYSGELSLDGLVTEVYGRTYSGQQTNDCYPNDTKIDIVMDDDEVAQQIYDDESFEGYDEPSYPGEVRDYPKGMLPLRKWLEQPDGKYDFQHIRIAPSPETMLAYLVRDGHLPKGRYLIDISW